MKSHPRPRLFRTAVSSLLTTALVLTLGGPAAAQLADGPWSMYHHDVCHTGQSPNPGPLFAGAPGVPGTPGATDVKIWHGFDKLRTSPSLSADGATVYFGMGFDFCSVDAATMATNDCLLLPADVSDSSPAVGANGTIYMGDRDNSLNAYTSNPSTKKLSLKWRYNHGHEGDIWQHPAIAPSSLPQAGTIYFTHDQSTDGVGIFTALLDGGTPTVKWKFKIGKFVRQSSPTIDENGIIYFGDLNGYVYAFRDKGACPDNGTLRTQPALTSSCNNVNLGPVLLWKKQVGSTPGITASPVISADSNTLYIGTMAAVGTIGTPSYIPMGLTALDISTPCSAPPCAVPAVKWTFKSTGKVDQTPALGRDGTLYVPAINGGEKRLYAVNPSNGSVKWTFGPFNMGSESSAQPIVGGDGTVYVGLGNIIYALNPASGSPTTPPTQLWTYPTTNYIQSSPLIGPITGGRAILYVPSRDHNLYAISSQSHSNSIVPTTCWTEGGAPPGNQPPVADAGTDQSVTVNTEVTFNGSGSYDPDGDPLTVTWNFGDNSSHGPCLATDQDCLNAKHAYTTANVYTATLTVSDGHGGTDSDTVTITVTAGGGGGGNFVDNFNNRGDSTDIGGTWVEAAGDLKIESNQLKNVLRGDNIAHLPNLTGASQSAAANFISTDNNAGPRLGLVLRYTDARTHYRMYLWTGGTNQLRISKFFNGAETLLKSIAVTPAPAVGTTFHLVGSASANHLTATIVTPSGSKSVTVDDATYATGTIGVLINSGATVGPQIADDFCASIGGTCP